MTTVTLSNSTVYIEGELVFGNIMRVRSDLLKILPKEQSVKIDLAKVSQVDSAALVLFSDLLRALHAKGQASEFINTPPSLLSMATIMGVADVLGLR